VLFAAKSMFLMLVRKDRRCDRFKTWFTKPRGAGVDPTGALAQVF
jgi:hypothetical protein